MGRTNSPVIRDVEERRSFSKRFVGGLGLKRGLILQTLEPVDELGEGNIVMGILYTEEPMTPKVHGGMGEGDILGKVKEGYIDIESPKWVGSVR